MNSSSPWSTVLSYVIPVVSIAITYVFGRLQSVEADKKSAYMEAYDEFYLPFITMLYKVQIWDTGFARLSIKERHQLFRLVSDNIKYMNKEILEYVDVIYHHYEAILAKEQDGIDSIFTHDRTDEMFDELTKEILSRATWLAKKLHQPPIGEFVLELYLDEIELREKRLAKAKQDEAHS